MRGPGAQAGEASGPYPTDRPEGDRDPKLAEGSVVWTVGGTEYLTATPADVAPNDWAYNHAFYLLLNLAVGGNFGGPVAPDTVFPAAMLIDYVRIYAPAG